MLVQRIVGHGDTHNIDERRKKYMAKSIPINTVLTYRLKQRNRPVRFDALLYSVCLFVFFCYVNPFPHHQTHNICVIIFLKMYLGEINLYT